MTYVQVEVDDPSQPCFLACYICYQRERHFLRDKVIFMSSRLDWKQLSTPCDLYMIWWRHKICLHPDCFVLIIWSFVLHSLIWLLSSWPAFIVFFTSNLAIRKCAVIIDFFLVWHHWSVCVNISDSMRIWLTLLAASRASSISSFILLMLSETLFPELSCEFSSWILSSSDGMEPLRFFTVKQNVLWVRITCKRARELNV